MPTIAIISQKGGAGKTTLALHLAAAAEDSGHTALVIDLDPQATASQWAAWRRDAPPVVIDSAPPRLAAKIEQATAQGAAFAASTGPVFAYCASGNRSSIVWALANAGKRPADELIGLPARFGYQLDHLRPQIEALAKG